MLSYRCLKFVELLASQKSSFSIFPVLKGLNIILIFNQYIINNTNKKSKPFQTSQACKTVTFQAISTKAEAFFSFLLKL